eukprot:scaffold121_cov412-Prasinococcus_capsulatus_cf.AAC.28
MTHALELRLHRKPRVRLVQLAVRSLQRPALPSGFHVHSAKEGNSTAQTCLILASLQNQPQGNCEVPGLAANSRLVHNNVPSTRVLPLHTPVSSPLVQKLLLVALVVAFCPLSPWSLHLKTRSQALTQHTPCYVRSGLAAVLWGKQRGVPCAQRLVLSTCSPREECKRGCVLLCGNGIWRTAVLGVRRM